MDAHWWRRIFLGNASEVELDATSRVLISPALRSAAALDKEVAVAMQGLRHCTVLLEEAVNALIWRPDGIYIDGTFGRGGHSQLVLERLGADARLVAFDKDPQALLAAQQITDRRFEIVHSSFANLQDEMAQRGVERVAGILLDLGVSSPQLDDPERGFSFQADGPLDMRMDSSRGESAAQWLARVPQQQLTEVIRDYGEERFAHQIAKAIIARQAQAERLGPITRTRELAEIVASAVKTRESRYQRTLALPATRGKIFDRNGVVLATSLPVRAIWAIPEDVPSDLADPKLEALGKLLGLSRQALRRKLAEDKSFVYIKRQVPLDLAKQVAALDIPGIYQRKEYQRFYPEGEITAHLVGFTNIEDEGQEGIELSMQKQLIGMPGSRRVIKDRMGRVVEDVDELVSPRDGRDLTLSIDSKLQYIAYTDLKAAVLLNKAKAGAAIVLDAHTGEVLALVNYPAYNPNRRAQLAGAQLRNRVLTDTFEPGSIMKPLTLARALDLKRVAPTTLINTSPGRYKLDNATISDSRDFGVLTVANVLQKSSNIGITKIALQLKPEEMWDMFTSASERIAGVQVISPQTARQVRQMLEAVIAPGGTAPAAQLADYRAGGKTGTAYKHTKGQYDKAKYRASFVGIAPMSAPRIIVAISIDEPSAAIPNLTELAGPIASEWYGAPSQALLVIGVTGTNGKTSCSHWVAQALSALDKPCAIMGTLGAGLPGKLVATGFTTPDATQLQRSLAQVRQAGAQAVAIEVSSHGLQQERVNGIAFDTAIFTNLSHDHLDYHGTLENYESVKARLFDWPTLRYAIINCDDAAGARLLTRLHGKVRTIAYGLHEATVASQRMNADGVLRAQDIRSTTAGTAFKVNSSWGEEVPFEVALAQLARLEPVLGRMQQLGGNMALREPLVVVDFAHTPDALEQALVALRPIAQARGGKLACIFGCGGNRDTTKRALMGHSAERLADAIVLTSDNPRHEEPAAIIDEILHGMSDPTRAECIEDRARAILRTIRAAACEDVILLAGKGHEMTQEIQGQKFQFSDQDHVRLALAARATQALAAIAEPTIALINNAQREHQEFMASVEAVAHEHANVLRALPVEGIAVLPADDVYTLLWRNAASGRRIIDFALASAAAVSGTLCSEGRLAVQTDIGRFELTLPVLGVHNARNALAATAVALAAGVALTAIRLGLEKFQPASGRLVAKVARVGPFAGAMVIDDSYNANPDSMRVAIDVLATRAAPRVLVIGAMGEVGQQGAALHREVGIYARERGIDAVYALGEATRDVCSAFGAQAKHFSSAEALIEQLLGAGFDASATVLVKGSRFMQMERIVAALGAESIGA
ncbi:hypothetical protein BGZ96_002161 [Linnemannia gamsii]|uniref:UDP-N-acetylmuramoyl-L-alanyl-D-glutamate--2,6-diaminopimelate ligase n=1 Tax=Linnemannia gamsii TaxID=64522 RepID=A0ABQ7KI36_9FUNG|nr:hypothetical protein BGZ96_002161 [Linnemannia gamsii]